MLHISIPAWPFREGMLYRSIDFLLMILFVCQFMFAEFPPYSYVLPKTMLYVCPIILSVGNFTSFSRVPLLWSFSTTLLEFRLFHRMIIIWLRQEPWFYSFWLFMFLSMSFSFSLINGVLDEPNRLKFLYQKPNLFISFYCRQQLD